MNRWDGWDRTNGWDGMDRWAGLDGVGCMDEWLFMLELHDDK